MSENVLSLVTFLRDSGGEPTRIEAKARTLAEEGVDVGTFAGIPVVANEDCPPNVIYVLPSKSEAWP